LEYIFSWSYLSCSLYSWSFWWSLNKISFWIITLTKGFYVKGDWLNIGFNKSLWYDPWKRKFFKTLFFVWFDLEPTHPPFLVCEFHHLFSYMSNPTMPKLRIIKFTYQTTKFMKWCMFNVKHVDITYSFIYVNNLTSFGFINETTILVEFNFEAFVT